MLRNNNGTSHTLDVPTRLEHKKRDRPLSSYFDTPCEEINNEIEVPSKVSSPTGNGRSLRNISNLVFPHMKKWTAKGLTRSMSAVSETSKFFTSSPINGTEKVSHDDRTSPQMRDRAENTHNSTASKLSCSLFSLNSINDFQDTKESPVMNKTFKLDLEADREDDHSGDSEDSDLISSPTQVRHAGVRPGLRGSFRRTHSLFETTKEKENFCMDDNSHLKNTSIKSFKVVNDLLPRIDDEEMISILNGNKKDDFDEFIIIDCRFNYEYEGGHIEGAINLSSQEDLESRFLSNHLPNGLKKQLLIFHCEFSSCRGPKLANHLRKCDRKINSNNYPMLSYPDVVILSGGYKRFYDKFKQKCVPQGYIEMNDVKFQDTCENEMHKVRQANKLTRVKSNNHSFPENALINTHLRSHSYSITKSHTQNLKILKRHKSTLEDFESSVSPPTDLSSRSSSQIEISKSRFPGPSPFFNDDDTSSTKSDQRQSSGLFSTSFSCNSSFSSIGVDSVFSSSDSLLSATSNEQEDFELKSSNLNTMKGRRESTSSSPSLPKSSLLKPMPRKPRALPPPLPRVGHSMQASKPLKISNGAATGKANTPSAFKFPNDACGNGKRGIQVLSMPPLSKPTIPLTSPTVSSPLSTATPICNGSSSSLFDPINDTAGDFNVPYPNFFNSESESDSLFPSGRENYLLDFNDS